MNFHLISLGCPKNTVDSEHLIASLEDRGLTFVPGPEQADLVLINTCGFIKEAKEESIGRILQVLELKRDHPRLKVVAFGCLAKRYLEQIRDEIPELDGLFPFFTGTELDGLLPPRPARRRHHGESERRLTPPHIGYLKISEGCSNRCTYCAIPDIRGPFQAHPTRRLLEEAAFLARTGAREIVIVAQDTTQFARGDEGLEELATLIREIGALPGVHWIRLQYLHPRKLTDAFLETIFHLPKVVPYFDVPFQHVADRLLELMNRGVTKRDLVHLLGSIRKRFPKAVVRTTFIVGFPGETEKEFAELVEFIERHPIDRLGAFPYSPEEGTPAARLKPRLPKHIKTRRLDELMTLQGLLASERNGRLVGSRQEVLIDRLDGDGAKGRTYGDSFEIDNEVIITGSPTPKPGEFVTVRVTEADSYDLHGTLCP